MKVTQYHDEFVVETDGVCRNCRLEVGEHVEGKCPFEATQYVSMSIEELHTYARTLPHSAYPRNFHRELKEQQEELVYTYTISFEWE